jgi:hypothetical protein
MNLYAFSDAWDSDSKLHREMKHGASWSLIILFMLIIVMNIIFAIVEISIQITKALVKLWFTKIRPWLNKKKK